MTTINQVIAVAEADDATTSIAQQMERSLGELATTGIYARHRDAAVARLIGHIDEMPPGAPSDVLIYHAGFGDPHVTRFLLSRPERLVLVYHDITPSRYYLNVDPSFAAGLEWGRHELRLLRDRTVLSIADSQFNANELAELGYNDTIVVPTGLCLDRLRLIAEDPATIDQLRQRMPETYVVSVSQLLPHKRQDVLIQAAHILQWCHDRSIGLVLVGTPRSHPYEQALSELTRRLRVSAVWHASGLSDAALGTVMRHASVFASASEHEGLAWPALEAMALDVPTISRDCGAVRETLADAALILPRDAGPLLYAAAIERALDNQPLRAALVMRGRERAAEVARASQPTEWLRYVHQLVAA